MLDFSSSLYLGMTHPSSALEPWEALTTGRPAALGEPDRVGALERALAALQGCERAVLAPSTLHVAWDLFGLLGEPGATIYVDDRTYPIARWGAERAHGRGARVVTFEHHDPADLARVMAASGGERGLVVTDGYCPSCGAFAPLPEYLDAARSQGALLVVDDTQALGVFGTPSPGATYGAGGGGGLRHLGVQGPDVLVLASLAKGFGVPVAALSGARSAIALYRRRSSTRVHSSPPSAAVVAAAARALTDNASHGERLRRRLAANVRRLRGRLRAGGLLLAPGAFPIVCVRIAPRSRALAMHAALARRGVRGFVRPRCRGGTELGLVVRADHEADEVDRAADALLAVARDEGLGVAGSMTGKRDVVA